MERKKRKIVNFENAELGANIRVIDRDGDPWFVAKDVAQALGYAKTRNAVSDHCKGGLKMRLPSNGGNQEMIVIPEADIYRLILHSNLPKAEAFQDWVVEEVLPSIRKHGAYMTPKTIDDIRENPESVYFFARALCEERDRREIAEERLECVRPRIPFGTRSRINGLPRTRLIPSFWRSTRTTTVTTEVTEYQRSLFDTMIQLTV